GWPVFLPQRLRRRRGELLGPGDHPRERPTGLYRQLRRRTGRPATRRLKLTAKTIHENARLTSWTSAGELPMTHRISLVDARTSSHPHSSLLYQDGREPPGRPLRYRRARLENVVAGSEFVLPVCRLASNGFEAWAEVIARDYEGLVAKDEASL